MGLNLVDFELAANCLAGRVILITGAGDGIGKALALSAAEHGATVILLGRTTHKLEQVYDQINGAKLPQPAIYPVNLENASYQDYESLAHGIEQEFGRLDGLVHNAAELGELSPLASYDPITWARVFQVNLHAPFMLTQNLLGLLRASHDASIIFSADQHAREHRAYWGAYAVSKSALESFMQVLANEFAQSAQIRVNSLDPGPARTRLRANAFPGEDPMQVPAPAELARPFLYLLGPQSKGITGQAL